LAANLYPPTTAGIRPDQFPEQLIFARNTIVLAIFLGLLLVAGFAFRVYDLGAEGFGEDEFNKLQTVDEYRQNGLSSRNGEHPFLMKGLQTISIVAREKLNNSFTTNISEEAALRFPIALFGTFSALMLFFLVSELFARSIGLVSAALWTVEPLAIGFDRVAKEDSLVLFFFLFAAWLWVKAQTAAEIGRANWLRWVWLAAIAFGAMLASKYYLNLFAVAVCYYHSFNRLTVHKWGLGKRRWLPFFIIMGASLIILSPPLLLPDTWREMLKFSSEGRIGHDSYEFMGVLYTNKFTAWLQGVPWTFYYVFAAVKSSLTTLAFFAVGLLFVGRRKMGDGRTFLFFWCLIWFLPLTLLGGKFTRYFTATEPLLLIVAAVGFCFVSKWVAERVASAEFSRSAIQVGLLAALLVIPVIDSLSAAPHYRLFDNWLGGGTEKAGKYFPHDEFYDASTRDVMADIGARAPNGAVVACETPALLKHYAEKVGRPDLSVVSLSDKSKVVELRDRDFVVLTMGRKYFSNSAYFDFLHMAQAPHTETSVAGALSSEIYQLDDSLAAGVRAIAAR
jgi:hypothetical protein